jgi:putative metallohydrolase (TIGR04338 family)
VRGINATVSLDEDWPEELKPHFTVNVSDNRFNGLRFHAGFGGGDIDDCRERAIAKAEEIISNELSKRAQGRHPPKTGKRRDQQRSKLYKADDAIKPFALELPAVADVERYVNKVWASERCRKAFPRALGQRAPEVADGRGTRRATGGYWEISIPRWARNSAVVLHELAHTIAIREHGAHIAGHGWEYCGVFLKLVLYLMGRDAHDAFKASMKSHRVRFRAKKARQPMSPERREQLIQVLAAARAARSRS